MSEAASCAACGRVFGPSSKPRWAFTRAGQPAGQVHTSCSMSSDATLLSWHDISQDAAWLNVWYWHIRQTPRADDERLATYLLEEPVETLTDAQITHVLKYQPEHLEAATAVHARLIHEFLAWRRASQPQAPTDD